MSLAQQLFNNVRRFKDCPAISFKKNTKNYNEFLDRVMACASFLSNDLELAKGSRVAVYEDNCPEIFEILFGCWAGGFCVVPVNSKLHPAEVDYILSDCDASVCFVSGDRLKSLSKVIKKSNRKCALYDPSDILGQITKGLNFNEPLDVPPEHPSWIFYTSGTTGKPKGAILSQRNLQSMCHAYYADIDLPKANDVKLHAAPLSHGSGLYGIAHILRGGHQVIMESFDPEKIIYEISQQNNVTMFAAPTMISRLMNCANISSANFDNLKLLYYGGGPMYQSELLRALKIFGPRLYHLYGQGEAPMTIAGHHQNEVSDLSNKESLEKLASCGFARSGVSIKVVDNKGQSLPENEAGEILVRGDVVMQGYWGNKIATKKAIKNGWLYTGDIGYVNEYGYLQLKDRVKDMIISGGTNIYPREVEEILLTLPSIQECSVVGMPDPDWGETVVAFVVMQPEEVLDIPSIDNFLLQKTARFKRPKSYYELDRLPKNNYGKVLKTELREIATGLKV